MEFIIETSGLTKKFGKDTAVSGLNMKVPKGEVYGFLGPNGAGKTTTIRMLLGLMKPTSGTIHIFQKDLQKERISILKRVGSLVEQPSYYPHLTGYEKFGSDQENFRRAGKKDRCSARTGRAVGCGP